MNAQPALIMDVSFAGIIRVKVWLEHFKKTAGTAEIISFLSYTTYPKRHYAA